MINRKSLFLINPLFGFRSIQHEETDFHSQHDNNKYISTKSIQLYDDLKLTIEIYDLGYLTVEFIQNNQIKFMLSEVNNYKIYKKSKNWLDLQPLVQTYIIMVARILSK